MATNHQLDPKFIKSNQNTLIFIQETECENDACEMSYILFRARRVKANPELRGIEHSSFIVAAYTIRHDYAVLLQDETPKWSYRWVNARKT